MFLRKSSAPRFRTMFSKYLLQISTILLSFETASLFTTKVILSSFKVLSVIESCMVFQKKLFSVMYFTLTFLLSSFLVFFNSWTQKCICFLCADLVASIFSF